VHPKGIQSQRAPGPGLAVGYWSKKGADWALAARPKAGWAGSNGPSPQGVRKRPGWAKGPKSESASSPSPSVGCAGEAGGGGAAAGRAGVAGHAWSAKAKTGASLARRPDWGSRRPPQVVDRGLGGVARSGDRGEASSGADPGRCTGAAAAAGPGRRKPCTRAGPSPSRRKRGEETRRKREPLPPGAKADRRPWRREPPSSAALAIKPSRVASGAGRDGELSVERASPAPSSSEDSSASAPPLRPAGSVAQSLPQPLRSSLPGAEAASPPTGVAGGEGTRVAGGDTKSPSASREQESQFICFH
jgi:hypothetical protein